MTQNKRIVLNTLATYGRSLIGVVCGIFSARWVLESLGQEDFGLYSVVGGMVVFMSFFNIQFAGAISRYYAYSIGRARVAKYSSETLAECRAWFTTAVVIHTVIPIVLLIFGLPLGICAIRQGLVCVPDQRLGACQIVWCIVCISSFVGMVSVPFQAMYTAKQYIAELTIYSFLQTISRTLFAYFMVISPGDWLVPYAIGMGVVSAVPQIIICARACCVFKECRFVESAFLDVSRIRQLAGYAIWTAVGGLGYIASHQCMSIVFNNFYDARVAGSFGISQTVSGEAASLTGALQSAFQPAITTAFGAGDDIGAMAFFVCKIGTLLTLLFALPFGLEIDEILRLWLNAVPPFASQMCVCVLAFIVLEKLSCGHVAAVNATGDIAKFQMARGLVRSSVIILAIITVYFGWGVTATAAALPVSVLIVDFVDVLLAKKQTGMSVWYWVENIFCPILIVALSGLMVGLVPKFFFAASVWRVILTAVTVVAFILPISWIIVLNKHERSWARLRVKQYCFRTNKGSKC